jgi:formamidopyrimidine-DNA glycosylase
MPELPEVENIALALRANLLSRRLTGLKVRFAGVLSQSSRRTRRQLLGKQLTAVNRHGKYLLLAFQADDEDPAHLMIHLRMTGQIFIDPTYRPDKHVHLTLDFEGLPVYYRDIRKFGRFKLLPGGNPLGALSHIGPDMLAVRFPVWHGKVAARRAPLKSVLLDQGIAAGLGNIYADEALHRAGIHPLTVPAVLNREELKRLFLAAKGVLRLAIRHGGTTFLNFANFHGRPGNFRRKLLVYQRTGEPCRNCGAAIARLVIAGRASHFCPRCQPAPGA